MPVDSSLSLPLAVSSRVERKAAGESPKRKSIQMTLRHPAEDLASRTPVWVAMTEFFLDTELTLVTLSHIAATCAASPYSIRELERIMFTEVWPAFLPNLLSVAGEWAGWEEAFVQRRILECYRPRFYSNHA